MPAKPKRNLSQTVDSTAGSDPHGPSVGSSDRYCVSCMRIIYYEDNETHLLISPELSSSSSASSPVKRRYFCFYILRWLSRTSSLIPNKDSDERVCGVTREKENNDPKTHDPEWSDYEDRCTQTWVSQQNPERSNFLCCGGSCYYRQGTNVFDYLGEVTSWADWPSLPGTNPPTTSDLCGIWRRNWTTENDNFQQIWLGDLHQHQQNRVWTSCWNCRS